MSARFFLTYGVNAATQFSFEIVPTTLRGQVRKQNSRISFKKGKENVLCNNYMIIRERPEFSPCLQQREKYIEGNIVWSEKDLKFGLCKRESQTFLFLFLLLLGNCRLQLLFLFQIL